MNQCADAGAEVADGSVGAASFGEGRKIEVLSVEVAGLDDGGLDVFEPPHFSFGEFVSGLGLLGEPVGPAFLDGGCVGDEFVVVSDGVADEGYEVGGGVAA